MRSTVASLKTESKLAIPVKFFPVACYMSIFGDIVARVVVVVEAEATSVDFWKRSPIEYFAFHELLYESPADMQDVALRIALPVLVVFEWQ